MIEFGTIRPQCFILFDVWISPWDDFDTLPAWWMARRDPFQLAVVPSIAASCRAIWQHAETLGRQQEIFVDFLESKTDGP